MPGTYLRTNFMPRGAAVSQMGLPASSLNSFQYSGGFAISASGIFWFQGANWVGIVPTATATVFGQFISASGT